MTEQTRKIRVLEDLLREALRHPAPALARTVAGALSALPMLALANPTGGQVVAGSATLHAPANNGLVIDQSTQNAVINWQSFSVGGNEYVQFIQPSSSAVVLNRVVGNNPSQIFGNIKANGQVFLVNPYGVFFAPGATLDVQGILATTQDIKDSDFMAGRYAFSKAPGAPDATVINQGTITAGSHGYVVLAGDYVENDGVINAQSGRVVLAAGGATQLTLSNDELIGYMVNSATLARLAGVDNAGQITADGGTVIMTADVANTLTATAVNNTGLVAAHSVQNENGVIVLTAQGGDIENSGTLDASATDPGVAGGTVIVRGNGLTKLDPTSVIDTEGDQASGGFIELSGHTLTMRGEVTAGRGGSLLIDPANIKIVAGTTNNQPSVGTPSIGTGAIATLLATGNVTIVASKSISRAAGSHISASAAAGNLKFAIGTVPVGGSCGLGGICVGAGAPPTVTKAAGGTIKLTGLTIKIGGAFTASATAGVVSAGAVTAKAINISGATLHAGALTATGVGGIVLNAGQGSIAMTSAAKITANNGTVTLTGGNVSLGSVSAGGKLTITVIHGPPTAATLTVASGKVLSGKSVAISGSGSYGGKVTASDIHATGGSINIIDHAGGIAPSASAAVVLGNLTATGGKISVTDTGVKGKVTVGSVHAASSGIQLSATETGSGGNISFGKAAAKTIRVTTTTPKGGNITATSSLNATGAFVTGSNAGMGIVLNPTANGLQHSGAKVVVAGTATATAGGVRIHTLFSGASAGIGGSVSVHGITAKTIDIETQGNNRPLNKGGITVNGNLLATGTATNAGVILISQKGGGSASGNIKVTGSVTASHAMVQIADQAKHGAPPGSGITVGAITASKINLSISGGTDSGTGAIQTGNLKTTAGAGHNITVNINNTRKDKITIGGSISAGGSLAINEHGHFKQSNLSVSGPIKAGGNVKIQQGGGSGSLAMVTKLGNITAGGSASLALGHGGVGNINVTLGNIAAKSEKITASGGGSIAVTATGSLDLIGGTLKSTTTTHLNVNGNLILNGVTINATGFNASAGGNLDYTTPGNLNLSTLHFKATKALTLTAGAGLALKGAHLAGSAVNLNVTGNVSNGGTAASISGGAGGVSIKATGNVLLSADTLHVTGGLGLISAGGSIDLTAATVATTNYLGLNAGKNIVLSLVNMNVGSLYANAGGSLHNGGGPGTITAGGVNLIAGTNINLSSTQLNVGNGLDPLPPGVANRVAPAQLLGSLATLGLAPAVNYPNGAFTANGSVTLGGVALVGVTQGGVTLTGSYLLLQAPSVSLLGPVSVPAKAVIQVLPASNTYPVQVESQPVTTAATLDLSNAAFISLFPGATVVVGGDGYAGNVTLASQGKFALAAGTNLIIDTSGNVTGLGDVTSTGVVVLLQSLLGPPVPPPTSGEIDPTSTNNNNTASNNDKKQQVGGGTTGTGSPGGITQDTGNATVCH